MADASVPDRRMRGLAPWDHRWATLAGLLFLLVTIAFGSGVRIRTAFSSPLFDATRPEGMLKSDPALLYYITQRIIDSGGLPPEDFRADPRIEHPLTTDIPATFAVGQEFLIAWLYRLAGGDLPLHAFCVIVMGVVASLAAVGVYGLALELSGRVALAAFAAGLYAVTPANYRTLGFILQREDLSLPLFALHLWLLARAVRVRSAASLALAAAALALALATWHAMAFLASLLAVCIFAWFLRSGENPLAGRHAWVFVAVLAAASLVVPVLRAGGFLLSLPMQIAASLLVAARVGRRRPLAPRARMALGLGAFALAAGVALAIRPLLGGGSGDYAHVLELLASKLAHLGVRPADPTALSFGARLLWQGPFDTNSPERLLRMLFAAGIALPFAIALSVPIWRRGSGDGRAAVLMAFALLSLGASFLLLRLEVLCGLLAPAALAVLLRGQRPGFAAAWAMGLGAAQGLFFAWGLSGYSLGPWYDAAEIARVRGAVEWIRDRLPDDGAIASDFVHSTSLLAHTGHPIVVQPKYETRRSRDRIEALVTGFYRRSPEGFGQLLREEFDARYLLIDVPILWDSRYQAGLPFASAAPPPGSAAESLLAERARDYRSVPGFRLLYASAEDRALLRLYEVEPGSGAPTPAGPGPP